MHQLEAQGTYHRQRARATEGPVSHRAGCTFTRDLLSAESRLWWHSHMTAEAVEAGATEAETDAEDGIRLSLGLGGERP